MTSDNILQLFLSLLPAIIVAAIAYYFFKGHIENENGQRRYKLQRELQKEALPLRLQAYERMALFLERISPNKLIVRVQPTSSNKEDYENLLIASIEQEYEHNLAQQIYISDKCWDIISAAKNTTIQLIRKASMQEKVDSASKLREVVLSALMDKQAPSSAALAFIKDEVSNLW
ncbi:hypothetical protein BTO05_01605 [Winogradskyella sp. PC-19]|uniref:DUF7935 family protein n=1 Tax=unclassified Winogradskyella TaxID=2615021 RepID=UPI000B3C69FD|nr:MULTISPECIES: hypothetical protein [unclassified Winogradskyella]ARV08400.1 hypothetical protein BTO05_01605 [Winogradskyella sp. PC-19]RZN80971.1 MAG: hypothetical protein EVB12_03960 [Winogradskyella sp.]